MMKTATAFLTALFLLFLWPYDSQGQEVWTYDFGDEEGTFDSGDETNPSLLPSTQDDGGDTRLRIGGGNEIILSQTDNDVGTFSRMILEASPTGGLNIFGIGGFDSDELLYIRATLKISVSEAENENEYFIVLNSSDGFDATGIDTGTLFGGLRFIVQDDGEIETTRRSGSGTGSWATSFDYGTGLIDLDQIVTLEIYANNSSTSAEYYRNGEEFTLNNGFYAVWLNGSRIEGSSGSGDAAKVGNFSEGTNISSVRFMGGATDGDESQMEIDDIVYANHLPVYREITGEEGWRMLSSPVVGMDVETLNRQNQVQGIEDAFFEHGSPNVLTYSPEAGGWEAPDNMEASLNQGKGFIWYLFDNDDELPSKPLPMGLVSKGNAPDSDVTDVELSDAVSEGEGENFAQWNFLGNPFGEDLQLETDWHTTWTNAGDLASSTAQVWDPEIESFVMLNEEDYVAAFQGFFVENDGAESIDFPIGATASDEAEFYKQQNNRRVIAFEVQSADQSFTDRGLQLLFHTEASHEWDVRDATKLTSLNQNHIGMAFVGQRGENTVLKAQDSRPYSPSEVFSIPVEFYAEGAGGDMYLSIRDKENIPSDWIIEIEDTQTNERQKLTSADSFSFSTPAQKRMDTHNGFSMPKSKIVASSESGPRFVMHVNPGLGDENPDLPSEVTLNQNYPNPFNPATTISYELPESAEVNLAVYDMLGRKVATLVNENIQAGSHQVTFDASNLSSGVYVYQLEAGATVLTRKLTVVK